jgi:uncharacterized integral membrane protein (TIGR00697 family)
MPNSMVESKIIPQPQYLWFFTLTFSMVIVLANWFDARLISIFGLATDAGTLVFPLTFLLSDMITEVYGFKYARRAIWCGFLFNAIFILYGQIIIHLPSPAYAATSNAMFDTLLAANVRIICASALSYLIAEPLNSLIMAKLKMKMQGRYMGIRFVSSTVVASGIDSFVFGTIAFYGTMSNQNLLALILTMWFIKVFLEVIGLPISISLTKKIKQAEQLDIYDKQTNFTVFSLDTHYSDNDNAFFDKDSSKHD